MNNNNINFRPSRTVAGTIMEIVVAAQILVLWMLVLYLSQSDTACPALSLVRYSLFDTVLAVAMMVCCYFPKTFNMPVRHSRAEHYMVTIQMIRVCSISMMPIFIAEIWEMARPADAKVTEGVQLAFGCVLILAVVYYLVKLFRMK